MPVTSPEIFLTSGEIDIEFVLEARARACYYETIGDGGHFSLRVGNSSDGLRFPKIRGGIDHEIVSLEAASFFVE